MQGPRSLGHMRLIRNAATRGCQQSSLEERFTCPTCSRACLLAFSRSMKSRPLVSHSLSTSPPTCARRTTELSPLKCQISSAPEGQTVRSACCK